MSFSPFTTASGFLLPSLHSAPPFFTQQPHPDTNATATEQWSKLILAYGWHRKLYVLRVEDAETADGEWSEVLRNERINRKMPPAYLSSVLAGMVAKNHAVYEPAGQTRSVVLHWRLPEEWAEVLHTWAISTGQLNTILTFYEITEPPLPSPLSGIPTSLLRKAIAVLSKSGRAQLIAVSDGEGVRFFAGK
ncbi:hypothetical protein HMN09_00495300 [Mycena chlorophos]|uniref:ESCRT-II complex vps25 subunit n=1 Tax=Mycena chlorophos TaxID=658473 RepID=A0A8H6T9H3_MYCCL|nr:hypothetical protein HMN09_00495300 [Mycena chlorophos]